jgi:hypothetical protein
MEINETFIIESADGENNLTGFTYTPSSNTFTISSEIAVLSVEMNEINGISSTGNILPTNDNSIILGNTNLRFRNINTVSGNSTVWSSSVSVNTPELNLGLDFSGNSRIITAENSILQNDTLNGGVY